MGSDYFSLVNPWYHAPTNSWILPGSLNIHSSLAFNEIDPMEVPIMVSFLLLGLVPDASPAAKVGAAGTGPAGRGQNFPQTFEFIVTAINTTHIHIRPMKILFSFVSFVVPR